MASASFGKKEIESWFLVFALMSVSLLPVFLSADILQSQGSITEVQDINVLSSEGAFSARALDLESVEGRTEPVEESNDSVVQNEENVSIIVGLNRTCSSGVLAVADIADANNGEVIAVVLSGRDQRAVVVEVASRSFSSFVRDVHKIGLASYIETRGKSRAQFWPDDPYFGTQWGMQKIEVDWAWNVSLGSREVLVAVLDTGIDWHHPDLSSNYVPIGYDWVNDDNDPMDDYGHGTHCAGTIAAALNNSQGIAGMAQVRIMAEKVLNNRGDGYSDWIANGIYHAVQQGAEVISMSFGDYDGSEVVHEAIKYAYTAGVLIVACVGNDNRDARFYPAAYPEVISVSATDSDDGKATFSNFGEWVELAAPGVGVLSTIPNNDYQSYGGTSVACPFVSGLCALILSALPNSTASFVRYLLRYSADDLGNLGFDEYYGYGRINAKKALGSPLVEREVVAFDLLTPPFLRPNVLNVVTAEIFNLGKNEENSIEIQLFSNSTLVWTRTLTSLPSYMAISVDIDWIPNSEGNCNMTLYALPLLGEANLGNNAVTKFIYVGSAVKAAVLRSSTKLSEEVIKNWNTLNSEWQQFGNRMVYVDYASLNKPHITFSNIVSTEADVLIVTNAHAEEFDNTEIDAIERYVQEGHGLIMTGDCFNRDTPNNRRLIEFTGLDKELSLGWFFNKTDMVQVLNTSHPLFDKVPNPIVLPLVASTIPSPSGEWSPDQLDGGIYLGSGFFKESVIVEFKGILYFSFLLETIPTQYHHHLQLLYNGILYSRYQKPMDQLKVILDSPRYLKPKQVIQLNATVCNYGQRDETDVHLSLSIGNTIVNSSFIPNFPSGASMTISSTYEPTVEGQYLVTANAVADGKEQTNDNSATALITAHFDRWVLWDTMHTTLMGQTDINEKYARSIQFLRNEGFTVHFSNNTTLSYRFLSGYDILVLLTPERDYSSSEIADIQEWVRQGGSLFVVVDTSFTATLRYLTLPYGIQIYRDYYSQTVTTNLAEHPITGGVNSVYISSAQRLEASQPSQEVVWTQRSGIHFGLVCADGNKRIVTISDGDIITNTGIRRYDNEQLFMNIFHWLSTRHTYEHEVAATLGVPTFVQRGQSTTVNATVRNKGSKDVIGVRACLWISMEEMQLIDILHLQSGESYTFKYFWSPPTEADFNITLYISPTAGENLTANNFATAIVPVYYYEKHYFANMRITSGNAMDWHSGSGTWAYTLTFDFPLFNHVYRTIYVSTDGLITFTEGDDNSGFPTRTLDGLLAIAPAYHHWSTTGDYDIYIGQPDMSHVIIRWEVIDDNDTIASFAAELGADGVIYFFYGFSNQFATAIIGISNGQGYMQADNVENINNLQTVVFTPFELEHEVSVMLQTPKIVSFGTPTLLNVTVSNLGSADETGISLRLLANESMVTSLTLPTLIRGSFTRTSIPWTPLSEGHHNITVYASPVPGEVYTGDNHDSRNVFVVANTTTYASLEPRTIRVEVGDDFTLDVYVNSVENMFTWQIKIYYNDTIFQCLEAWLPPDNVFAYSIPLVPPPLIEGNYSLIGATLMGSEWPYTGCGTLCKIRFRAIKPGNCTIFFDQTDTFLLNSAMKSIDFVPLSCIAETWLPDFNNDGIFDLSDITLIAGAFGLQHDDQDWNPVFDINHDSHIDMIDIAKIARTYGMP